MGRLESLVEKYRQTIGAPWVAGIADAQRVIFLVYEPVDEPRLRLKLGEFALATRECGHGWHPMDLTDAFPRWLSGHEYREEYFGDPELFLRDQRGDISGFHAALVEEIRREAEARSAPDAVFAVYGLGCLFGFTHISRLVDETKAAVRGRYLVFFPGDYHQNNYRLLDARDGWNYLALPISVTD
jgi:hypothetical protein